VALYNHADYLVHSDDMQYSGAHAPGVMTPVSGIYRCLGCGREDVSTQGHPLPPQNHHQHSQA